MQTNLRRDKPVPSVTVFNQISLDGFFTDARGAMSFAHHSALPSFEFSVDFFRFSA